MHTVATMDSLTMIIFMIFSSCFVGFIAVVHLFDHEHSRKDILKIFALYTIAGFIGISIFILTFLWYYISFWM